MSISRKPKPATPSTADVDAFISGAPDAKAGSTTAAPVGVYQKGIAKGHKRQISLTIAPDLLQRVDELAKRTGQGRAGIINLAIYQALEGDVFKA